MSRVTVAQLLERVEALEAELELLRAAPQVSISLNKDLGPPAPISQPLNVHDMARAAFLDYSAYTEEGDVYGPNLYL